MGEMAVKRSVIITIVIVMAALLFLGWFVSRPRPIEYSNDPADWLDKVPDGVSVDVKEATRGKGEYNGVNQQLLLPGGEPTAFAYAGAYRGNFFSKLYFDPNGKILMEFTPDLKPGDGILQGFIVERSFNGALEAHIFIDEDWRRALGNDIRIVWGAEYDKSKPFEFNQVSKGIYHDAVLDDLSRLQPEISVGGVQVGNMQPGGVDPAQAGNIIMMAIH